MPETDAPDAPTKSKNFITKKVGPLPLWTWVVVGAGIVGIILIYRRSQSGASTTSATNANLQGQPSAYGYDVGQQLGGYDSATIDSMFQTLQDQLGALQRNLIPPPSTTGGGTGGTGGGTGGAGGTGGTHTLPTRRLPSNVSQYGIQFLNPAAHWVDAAGNPIPGASSFYLTDPGGIAAVAAQGTGHQEGNPGQYGTFAPRSSPAPVQGVPGSGWLPVKPGGV